MSQRNQSTYQDVSRMQDVKYPNFTVNSGPPGNEAQKIACANKKYMPLGPLIKNDPNFKPSNYHYQTGMNTPGIPAALSSNRPTRVSNALNYMASKMHKESYNPIDSLTPEEINYLQTYLESKKKNMQRDPQSNVSQNSIDSPSSKNMPTSIYNQPRRVDRLGQDREIQQMHLKKFQTNKPILYRNSRINELDPIDSDIPVPLERGSMSTRIGKKIDNNYVNPYEYGGRQNNLGPQMLTTYMGPHCTTENLINSMGISEQDYYQQFPNGIRNLDVESPLIQGEYTHYPGQKEITMIEQNRFNLLPFDPQDTKHIIWNDNMPRNGYPTREDRMEIM